MGSTESLRFLFTLPNLPRYCISTDSIFSLHIMGTTYKENRYSISKSICTCSNAQLFPDFLHSLLITVFHWHNSMQKQIYIFFCHTTAQVGPTLLHFEISKSQTIWNTTSVGVWTSDKPVAEAITYAIQNKHKICTSMPSAESELTIPAIEWLQTYTLDCMATGIRNKFTY